MNEKLASLLPRIFDEKFDTIEKTSDFKDSEFWDSLKYVNLVVQLEQEFKIKLKKEDIQQLFSVASIRSVLARHGITN